MPMARVIDQFSHDLWCQDDDLRNRIEELEASVDPILEQNTQGRIQFFDWDYDLYTVLYMYIY